MISVQHVAQAHLSLILYIIINNPMNLLTISYYPFLYPYSNQILVSISSLRIQMPLLYLHYPMILAYLPLKNQTTINYYMVIMGSPTPCITSFSLCRISSFSYSNNLILEGTRGILSPKITRILLESLLACGMITLVTLYPIV